MRKQLNRLFKLSVLLVATQAAASGMYQCKNEQEQLIIYYDQETNVEMVSINYLGAGQEELEAPMDSNQSFVVRHDESGEFLSTTFNYKNGSMNIRFEAPNMWDNLCIPDHDRFGMPRLLPPSCQRPSKPASMDHTDAQGNSLMHAEFMCTYLPYHQ